LDHSSGFLRGERTGRELLRFAVVKKKQRNMKRLAAALEEEEGRDRPGRRLSVHGVRTMVSRWDEGAGVFLQKCIDQWGDAGRFCVKCSHISL
jgi:hypothetical protein